MLSVDKARCTGCGACVQMCPKNCISFVEGELGTFFPQIKTTSCIECGLCEKVCPIGKETSVKEKQKFFAAVNKDKDILQKSTSGGFFSAIAQYVLGQNGVVYGCSFTEDFQVKHTRVEQACDLEQLRGSKYVQSNTCNTFKEAKDDLDAGRMVLYTGTPCQIAGVKSFLGKEYGNLITVDIVCHGVGSQAFFDKYMQFMNQRHGKVRELQFRGKEFAGWSCGGGVVVVDPLDSSRAIRKPYYDYNNYYYHYFLHGDIYRESCYTCEYANINRPGDFTMGDFWGVESYHLGGDTKDGCSLVIANTSKANALLPRLGQYLEIKEVTREQATKANAQLVHPSSESSIRSQLIEQHNSMTGAQIDEAFRRKNRKLILKLHLKAMIPYRVKYLLRKIR